MTLDQLNKSKAEINSFNLVYEQDIIMLKNKIKENDNLIKKLDMEIHEIMKEKNKKIKSDLEKCKCEIKNIASLYGFKITNKYIVHEDSGFLVKILD